ncbi:MAG: thioesterase [Chloroflexi bacterium]|nr:thioesterase [Chloroflexota bacterium]
MAKVFTWEFKVRSHEINQFGIVSPGTFQNYLEETAIRASDAAGYDRHWYDEHHCSWIIRRMTVKYGVEARREELIEARSWVSDMRRVRSNREYQLIRQDDGLEILRGRADWVFVDTVSKRPKKVLPEFEAGFTPDLSTHVDLKPSLNTPSEVMDSPRFEFIRPVYYHEIDELGHVNNANYFHWIEDSYIHALQSLGITHPGQILFHDIEFLREARLNDTVKIASHVTTVAEDCMEWVYEITLADSGEVIARDTSIRQSDEDLLNKIVGKSL